MQQMHENETPVRIRWTTVPLYYYGRSPCNLYSLLSKIRLFTKRII